MLPPPPPTTGSSWGWLLGLGGLAFGAWALMRGGPKSNPSSTGESHVEGEPSGTYSLHAPTPTVQVTVNVGGADGTTTTSSTTTVPPAAPSLSLPSPSPVIEAVVVEEKPKRRRRRHRLTTQAKDENGKFLPAGTARKHVE